ncbi:MAG: type II toxin-antitoxin system RelE/ParE family toxin [Candidatus Daviesbacteria bacterium]|nr:type II toxin-antitoxin system RelE/ParE family toxin [Candidatus Daviesbacteria bacterium]
MEFEIIFYKQASQRSLQFADRDNSYKSPIEEFLVELEKSNLRLVFKTREAIERLRNRAYHKEPFSKHIEVGLWELRVKSGTDILRIFYTFEKGRIIILLHIFIKKKQKIPTKELEVARERLNVLRRIES